MKGILFSNILFIFSETSTTIPIGANKSSITEKVPRYLFKIYLSIIDNIIYLFLFPVSSSADET
ncbi:hypothetical protein GCM10011518_44280 [Flavobacterium limi]|uniref:Uncharacterized protein n=1 Tax=Flavobacterium limi TaxID=2045105 RepID=A0ABQ1UYB4_9FLAO|nr:hypothetical protein GCM10011518_44280 [Flavobacterium limi]